tara:strand:+ start:61 stop:438 length:378 start_codon:yes stop_codon:yes gene_type:complete
MADGVIMSPAFNEQVKRFVREAMRRERSTQNLPARWQGRGSGTVTVVLDAALAAATNALTTPGTAVASVLQKNSTGNLEDSGNNIDIVNRFENVSLVQYTIAQAQQIDGEWRLTAADCDALGAWP